MAKKDELNFENENKIAPSEKLKALQAAMDKIEKSFGKGSIMKMGDESVEQVEVIPTGSIGLNVALGVGGYPRGRIIEIYGPESSGKTTLAIHAIAEAQKAGGIAAFIDAEHAFDRFYAAKLGVDVDNLLISQPDNGEQALEIAEQLIRSSAIDIIVVDSVAALTPKAEIEGDMGDNKVGLQARLMSQALRKLTAAVSKTRTTCIFINQLREKIGVMFGNPETTTGGNALKFYASVRLDIRGSQAIKNGDEVLGKQTKVKVVKNKVAPPFRRAEFDIMFGEGISRAGEIIDLGADLGIIKKSGSWFSYNETKLAQGRDAAKQVVADNPELAEELEGLIFEALRKDKGGTGIGSPFSTNYLHLSADGLILGLPNAFQASPCFPQIVSRYQHPSVSLNIRYLSTYLSLSNFSILSGFPDFLSFPDSLNLPSLVNPLILADHSKRPNRPNQEYHLRYDIHSLPHSYLYSDTS